MTEEDKSKLRESGRQDLIDTYEIIVSGYAGIDKWGTIVDRRKNHESVSIPENPLFNIPKPKEI